MARDFAQTIAAPVRRPRHGRRHHDRLGIFRTPGLIARELGRPWLTFVAWLGGLLAFLGALCFAELATRHPKAGGKYVYAREAFGRRAGFVVALLVGTAWVDLKLVLIAVAVMVGAWLLSWTVILVATSRQTLPVRDRVTTVLFSYTFTPQDALIGKVTFRAVATIVGGRDALPADNVAIGDPTKVIR